jgi:hypothetical protein
MQEWLKMTHNLSENIIRTTRLSHEKPIVAELVIDAECVTSVGEVNPSFRDMVGKELSDANAYQPSKMVAKLLPRTSLGQLGKLPRAVIALVI